VIGENMRDAEAVRCRACAEGVVKSGGVVVVVVVVLLTGFVCG